MSYSQYTVEDFVCDPNFRKWVLKPDPEANFFWERWLIKNPHKNETVKEARILVKTLHFKEDNLSQVQKEKLFKRIRHTNQLKSQNDKADPKLRKLHHTNLNYGIDGRWYEYFVRYAAVISGILIFALSLKFTNWPQPTEEITISQIEYRNEIGQKKLQLGDGSTIILNAGSHIIYPERFHEGQREVFLSGEAFFEVVTDKTRPFIVKTDNLIARVLGTSFNLKAVEGSNAHIVSLISGKVEVIPEQNAEEIFLLEPGEQIALDNHTGEILKSSFDADLVTLWKDGILYFKDTPLTEVVAVLEKWYGVQIEVEKLPQRELPVTGRFAGEYLSNVLQSISFSLKFSYEINDKNVKIKF
ncbi:MAG: FecR domain-containing protein [Cyclobacteriaceae bacterium]|nr:FecR domain-containing protein [Cyclobacteriaceae bacterium]